MDRKLLGLVFGSGFLAELGDTTPSAIRLFAADREVHNKWLMLIGVWTLWC